ncbi:MAG: hypothetical protein QOI89_3512, partial [Solirubrobacteraceae bacterium]|nr:hypothetical protein [Solirubrobacteraceae bacterium]
EKSMDRLNIYQPLAVDIVFKLHCGGPSRELCIRSLV